MNILKKYIYNIKRICKICLSDILVMMGKIGDIPVLCKKLSACIMRIAVYVFLICILSTWFLKSTHNIEYTVNSEIAVIDGCYHIDTVGIYISMLKEEKPVLWKSAQFITVETYAKIKAMRPINYLCDVKNYSYKGKSMDSICTVLRIQSSTEIKYSKNTSYEQIRNSYYYDGNKHIFQEHGDIIGSHGQKKADIKTFFVPIINQHYCGEIELTDSLKIKSDTKWFHPNNIYRLCLNVNLRWGNKQLQQNIPKSVLVLSMSEPTDFISIYPEPDVRSLSMIEYHDKNKLEIIQTNGIHLIADHLENKNKHDLMMLFLAAILSILLSLSFSTLWDMIKTIMRIIKS